MSAYRTLIVILAFVPPWSSTSLSSDARSHGRFDGYSHLNATVVSSSSIPSHPPNSRLDLTDVSSPSISTHFMLISVSVSVSFWYYSPRFRLIVLSLISSRDHSHPYLIFNLDVIAALAFGLRISLVSSSPLSSQFRYHSRLIPNPILPSSHALRSHPSLPALIQNKPQQSNRRKKTRKARRLTSIHKPPQRFLPTPAPSK